MNKSLLVLGILLILAAPLVLISGTTYTLMLPNIYSSSARIKVAEDVPEINPLADQQGQHVAYNPYFLRTQFEIIQSKPILYEVINRLNLQAEWGTNGEKLPRDVALRILQDSVSVFQQRDTSLIYISVKRDNPNEAAKIANELAETYRDSRLDQARRETRTKIDAMNRALKEQLQRVNEAEKRVEQLTRDLEPPVDIAYEARLQELEGDRLAAQHAMNGKEAQLKGLMDSNSTLIDRASHATSDEFVVSMIQQLMEIETQLIRLKKDFGSNHPEVQKYHLQKKTVEDTLEQRLIELRHPLEIEYQIEKTRFETLDKVLVKPQAQCIVEVEGSNKFRPLQIAQSELDAERLTYTQLQSRVRQEMILAEVPRNPVEIIDVAEPNNRPVSPNLFMNVLVSAGIGALPFFAGIALIATGAKNRPTEL